MTAIPEGYELHDRSSPVTAPWEPIFSCRKGVGLLLGLFVRTVHTNSRGFLHGGVIAALADNAMGLSLGVALRAQSRPFAGLVTTALAVDYFGRSELGQWLTINPEFIQAGGTQGVMQALVLADAVPIARANATFRILKGNASLPAPARQEED